MFKIKKYGEYNVIIKDFEGIATKENIKVKKEIIDSFIFKDSSLYQLIEDKEYVSQYEINDVKFYIYLLLYDDNFFILFFGKEIINEKFIITTYFVNPFDIHDIKIHQYELTTYRDTYIDILKEILHNAQMPEGYTIIEKAFIQKEIAEKLEEEIRKRENERKI